MTKDPLVSSKESLDIRKEFKPERNGFIHQHVHHLTGLVTYQAAQMSCAKIYRATEMCLVIKKKGISSQKYMVFIFSIRTLQYLKRRNIYFYLKSSYMPKVT